MPIEPWWETSPGGTPRQELGMVSPELLELPNFLELPDKYAQGLFDVPVKPRYNSPNRVRDSDLASDRTAQPWARPPVLSNGPLFLRDRTGAVAEAPGHRGGIAGYR